MGCHLSVFILGKLALFCFKWNFVGVIFSYYSFSALEGGGEAPPLSCSYANRVGFICLQAPSPGPCQEVVNHAKIDRTGFANSDRRRRLAEPGAFHAARSQEMGTSQVDLRVDA